VAIALTWTARREGRGGKSLSPEEVVRIQREAQPVHFTVSVSGDLLIHSPLWERALALGGGNHYDFAPELAELKPYVADASLGICHVETPMTPAPPTSYPIFNTPPALAQGIKATGWDVCDTASNHSLDQGQSGIDDTGKALTATGSRMLDPSVGPAARRRLRTCTREGRLPRVHRHQRHPRAASLVGKHRDPADPTTLQGPEEGAQAVIVNIHWGGDLPSTSRPRARVSSRWSRSSRNHR
jgi:poly-gamma-glutamate synthesis protein (capsule biosynthesis protein)